MCANRTNMSNRSAFSTGLARIAKRKVHTHYDNLKTARNAPDEVIRASYKALSQKYHPDKNPHPDAARIMTILNASYAVLSDEVQRRCHDEWIAKQEEATPAVIPRLRQERREQESDGEYDGVQLYPATAHQPVEAFKDHSFWRNWRFDTPYQLALLLGGVLVLTVLMFSLLHGNSVSRLPSLMMAQGQSAPSASKEQADEMPAPFKTVTTAPTRIRFGIGPDGKPWPTGPRLYRDGGLQHNGLSTLIIDNSHNAHPVYVKIGIDAKPDENELYIPRHRLYSLEDLSPGTYHLRYRDLQTGMAAQSNPLALGDVMDAEAHSPGVLAVALRAIPSDNRDFHPIPESQF